MFHIIINRNIFQILFITMYKYKKIMLVICNQTILPILVNSDINVPPLPTHKTNTKSVLVHRIMVLASTAAPTQTTPLTPVFQVLSLLLPNK